MMMSILKATAAEQGDRLSFVSCARLADVKRDFDAIGVDTSPYYRFEQPRDLGFDARTVLVVASPSPPVSCAFTFEGRSITAVIPPSYSDTEKMSASIYDYLSRALLDRGHHIAHAEALPLKPIAVHAGLGAYGRNDIVYVEGMGSLLRLFLFYTDAPCETEHFLPLRRMAHCEACGLCVKNCPTGALSQSGSPANASRCLTDANEHGGDFPSWIDPKWHNALVGCVRCQFACPQNRPYLGKLPVIAQFSQEETAALLRGELPHESLEPLGLSTYYHGPLARNLAALIRRGAIEPKQEHPVSC